MSIEKPFVAVIMGSPSDQDCMMAAFDMLRELDVPFEGHIYSAHRTPDALEAYMKDAQDRGVAVYIAAAGMAAHLAGAIAARTTKPVLGVPMVSGSLAGVDALLSTVQMPGGVPVASFGTGRAGAKNAALFAAQVVSLGDKALSARVDAYRQARSSACLDADAQLQKTLEVMAEGVS